MSPGYGWLLRGVFGGLALVNLLLAGLYQFEPVREAGAILMILLATHNLWAKKISTKNSHWLDLAAALAGLFSVVAGGVIAGGPIWLSILRFIVGAFFMGALTDTMLLGHWYLVQPGLTRQPIKELLYWALGFWLAELIVWLLPTGMVSVFTGAVMDGQDGLLGWFWAASALTTLVLIIGSIAALKEKGYQAVMAVTGLAYLSLLTGFAQDIVARLALRPM